MTTSRENTLLPTLLPRLRAIAKRDLADRTISPGEALDLVELILATRAYVETLDTDGVADDDDLRDALAVIGTHRLVSSKRGGVGRRESGPGAPWPGDAGSTPAADASARTKLWNRGERRRVGLLLALARAARLSRLSDAVPVRRRPERQPRRVDFVRSWVRRRWVCFRHGHKWALDFPFGPNYCERCGRLVEW